VPIVGMCLSPEPVHVRPRRGRAFNFRRAGDITADGRGKAAKAM
jgi:hypothetical protein